MKGTHETERSFIANCRNGSIMFLGGHVIVGIFYMLANCIGAPIIASTMMPRYGMDMNFTYKTKVSEMVRHAVLPISMYLLFVGHQKKI